MKVLKKNIVAVSIIAVVVCFLGMYWNFQRDWNLTGESGRNLKDFVESPIVFFFETQGGQSVLLFLPLLLLTNNSISNQVLVGKHSRFENALIPRFGSYKNYRKNVLLSVFRTSFFFYLAIQIVRFILGVLLFSGKYGRMDLSKLDISLSFAPLFSNSWLATGAYIFLSAIGFGLLSLFLLLVFWKVPNPLVFRGLGLIVTIFLYLGAVLGENVVGFLGFLSPMNLLSPGVSQVEGVQETAHGALIYFVVTFLIYGSATYIASLNCRKVA